MNCPRCGDDVTTPALPCDRRSLGRARMLRQRDLRRLSSAVAFQLGTRSSSCAWRLALSGLVPTDPHHRQRRSTRRSVGIGSARTLLVSRESRSRRHWIPIRRHPVKPRAGLRPSFTPCATTRTELLTAGVDLPTVSATAGEAQPHFAFMLHGWRLLIGKRLGFWGAVCRNGSNPLYWIH